MADSLKEWERAAAPAVRATPEHARGVTAETPRPATRLVELTQTLERTRQYLDEACQEVRRLRIEHDRYHRFRDVSFGGVPCAQFWADFVLWEAVLNERPDCRGIVELGTWEGGFSHYLAAQAAVRGIEFRTYDSVVPTRDIPNFVRADVFAEANDIGDYVMSLEPVILFCDDGNKPRELRTFSGYLFDPRSLVVVHDWMDEVFPDDVPDRLEETFGGFCDEIGSASRVFQLREERA